MPYCGRYGCPCCTCQVCFEMTCVCAKRAKAKELAERLRAERQEEVDEWGSLLHDVVDHLEDT